MGLIFKVEARGRSFLKEGLIFCKKYEWCLRKVKSGHEKSLKELSEKSESLIVSANCS